jgi:glycosyltransferase involved in cell wall biosynthesis
MRVCFLVSEIFGWGKYGGYGRMVRLLAGGLAQRGVEVCAIVPRRPGQRARERVDGFTVLGQPGWAVLSTATYAQVDADVYHSQEATLATLGALRAMPDRKHIVTCIDPWNCRDWWTEFTYDVRGSPTRGLVYPLLWGYYSPAIVRPAVLGVDAVLSQTHFLMPKIQRLYHLIEPPAFLPNPYAVPKRPICKAAEPTVCYVARWDPRKRPEIFFELAIRFPKVRFIALGKAHNRSRDIRLRQRYGGLPNVELVGFVDPFESDRLNRVLERSWIAINTSAREGLPAAYVESAAYRCAILSSVDSDGFASRGGYHIWTAASSRQPAELGGLSTTVDDYAKGLEWLLEHDHWREKGEEGYQYVLDVHDQQKALDDHLATYDGLLQETA